MTEPGTATHPLRVAIIGAGPAGFYAAECLARQADLHVSVDLFDLLPTPFGLVRTGVAPDHPKIKNVTRVFERTAALPGVRFFGNVTFGQHLTLEDLQAHYHLAIFSTGAQVDRRLGIPGEDLQGSHSATEFVAWYNGHPAYRDLTFDLSHKRVAVVGVGNVAVDVARILCRTPDELAQTDIADYALEALRHSQVEEVVMLGRRGPAQAAFTIPEAKELAALEGADVQVAADEAALDALSRARLEAQPDRTVERKLEIIRSFVRDAPLTRPKHLLIRFLVSPVEILGDAEGHVRSLRIVRNQLYVADDGRIRPKQTDIFETMPVGLIFRSVGYRGVPLPELPFHDAWGIIPNEEGRVIDPESDTPVRGVYVAGWIKRGPTGVIGTNKACAQGTIASVLDDVKAGRLWRPEQPDPAALEAFVRTRQPNVFTYDDWTALDAMERARGRDLGRPRVKFTSARAMRNALSAAAV